MIYIGGYAAQKNCGIYQLNDDMTFHHQICDDEGTSYFDVDEQYIYTILKKIITISPPMHWIDSVCRQMLFMMSKRRMKNLCIRRI